MFQLLFYTSASPRELNWSMINWFIICLRIFNKESTFLFSAVIILKPFEYVVIIKAYNI